MSEIQEFRAETRAWLSENCPPGARGPGPVPIGSKSIKLDSDVRLWLDRMVERGWTVPTWPREYGGAALTNVEYSILIDEMTRISARPPLTGRGVNYIGPTILEYGTEDQKTRWLPICAGGEGAWAMGYSEPGAGSDLASLQTKAVREGDNYVINGRKTWTSDAMYCDFIFALVRTSPEKSRYDGISLMLIDLHQEGVDVTPIPLISGASPFCETLFQNAIASAGDVIGGVDNGWTVGKRLLQFERSTHAGINISGSQGGRSEVSNLPELVAKYVGMQASKIADPAIRSRTIAHEMNSHAQKITQRRAIAELSSRAPGFTSSAVKLTNALNLQEADELLMQAMGNCAHHWNTEGGATEAEVAAVKKWLYNKSLTIAGGTKEVQLNIIAKRVLGLPD
ncbi:MAG: acyl-CoA dehydrogenase family protein [Proteobacteria bacterium]|nr:acyl-CoA dehydrogenase family protein [Pseudomonadota bacterium]